MPILYPLIGLGAVFFLLALALWLTLRPRPAAPDIRCTILPPYEIPELVVVGTVLVENRGRVSARSLQLDLEYDAAVWSQIHHLRVATDVRYVLRGGGEGHSFAQLRLEELPPGQKIVIYMTGPRSARPSVRVRILGRQPARGRVRSGASLPAAEGLASKAEPASGVAPPTRVADPSSGNLPASAGSLALSASPNLAASSEGALLPVEPLP